MKIYPRLGFGAATFRPGSSLGAPYQRRGSLMSGTVDMGFGGVFLPLCRLEMGSRRAFRAFSSLSEGGYGSGDV